MHGDYLFSSTLGAKAIWISSAVKARLDDHMRRTLRALARRRGEDLVGREPLPRWTNHDIRRTVRSQLSSLKIPEVVCEAILAHARPGIKGVYDRYEYLDEKRDALRLWGRGCAPSLQQRGTAVQGITTMAPSAALFDSNRIAGAFCASLPGHRFGGVDA